MSDVQVESFNVDHADGTTHTLTNDVGSTSSAFVRMLSGGSRATGSGPIGSTANAAPNVGVGAVALTATDTLTFYAGNTTTRKALGEVWRYTGPSGGAHEFITRGSYTITIAASGTSGSQAVAGILSEDDCIPFITGVTSTSTSVAAYNDVTCAARMDGSGNVVVSRNATGGEAVTVYVTVVEFTGSAWTVAKGTATNFDATAETVTLSQDIGDWSTAIIFAHMEGDTGETGLSDTLGWAVPGVATNQVVWDIHQDVNARCDGNAYIHVLQNDDMAVYRAENTNWLEGDNTYATVAWPAGAPTDKNIDELAWEWFVDTTGTGTAHARGAVGPEITDATGTARAWIHRFGNDIRLNYGIVDLSALVDSSGGSTVIFLAEFTGTNGTALNVYTPDIPADGFVNWTSGAFDLQNGSAAVDIQAAGARVVKYDLGTTPPDTYTVEAQIKMFSATTGGGPGIFFGGTDAGTELSDSYLCTIWNGTLYIERNDAGSYTTLASKAYPVVNDTVYTYRAEVSPTGIDLYIDDVLELSTSDTTRRGRYFGFHGFSTDLGPADHELITQLRVFTGQVPATPTGSAATAAGTDQIDITWVDSDGDTYRIERSPDGSTGWTEIVNGILPAVQTYSDTGLSSGTTYFYRVFAVNTIGSSIPDSVVSATTDAASALTFFSWQNPTEEAATLTVWHGGVERAVVSTELYSSGSLAPGGFIEDPTAGGLTARAALTEAECNAFLPASGAVGEFTFPAPWNTTGVRLTNSGDVQPHAYSYWSQINNHVGSNEMKILVVFPDADGGPSIVTYNKVTGAVSAPVSIFNTGEFFRNHTAFQTAYFSATNPNWIYWTHETEFNRIDISNIDTTPLVAADIVTVFDGGDTGAGNKVWQSHSSADDRYHAMTYRTAGYSALGAVVYDQVADTFQTFPATGAYDECQIDKGGNWLVVKENVDFAQGEDNRIFDLSGGLAAAPATEVVLNDTQGAGGHSDLGYGWMAAADNYASNANNWKLWDLSASPITSSGTDIYNNSNWSVQAPNHASWWHAEPAATTPIANQFVVGSGANSTTDIHTNEIIGVPLDGSYDCLMIAPNMTDVTSGGGAGSYERLPKGCTDITGEWFAWTSNMGGSSRLDMFLVRIPKHLLPNAPP
jgi:hypothetical protein